MEISDSKALALHAYVCMCAWFCQAVGVCVSARRMTALHIFLVYTLGAGFKTVEIRSKGMGWGRVVGSSFV